MGGAISAGECRPLCPVDVCLQNRLGLTSLSKGVPLLVGIREHPAEVGVLARFDVFLDGDTNFFQLLSSFFLWGADTMPE